MKNLIKLKRFNSITEAELAKNLLKSHNIQAQVAHSGIEFPGDRGDAFGADLLVQEEDFEKAKEILEDSNKIYKTKPMPNQQPNLNQQFNQPPQPISSPPQKPKFNSKYILIVLILATLVGGGILVYQYWWLPRHETKPPEITIKNETANWQTYRNEEYGFEFKYPSSWFIYKENPADIFIQKEEEKSGSIPGPHADAFEIKVSTVSSGISLDQTVKNALPGLNFSKEEINIGGADGLKIKTTCEGVGCGAPQWFIIKNSNLYEIDSNLGHDETFDQILSTFKFTK